LLSLMLSCGPIPLGKPSRPRLPSLHFLPYRARLLNTVAARVFARYSGSQWIPGHRVAQGDQALATAKPASEPWSMALKALLSQVQALGILIGYGRSHQIATPDLPHAPDHGMAAVTIAEELVDELPNYGMARPAAALNNPEHVLEKGDWTDRCPLGICLGAGCADAPRIEAG
jgi:hypothetical protein